MPHADVDWPREPSDARRLVAVLIGEISHSDDDDRDEMLGILLERAWPTRQALRQ